MDDNRLEIAKARSIINLAEGYGMTPKNSGGGEMKLVCPHPDHKDTDASCYINSKTNLFKCHGCGWAGSSVDFVMGVESVDIKQAIDVLAGEAESKGAVKAVTKGPAKKKFTPSSSNQTAKYNYVDAKGQRIYASIRYDFPDGTKEFRMATYTGGNLNLGLKGEVERVPYKLDEFPDNEEVWFAEGEKCADSLAKLGIFCSCVAGGSNAKLEDITPHFKNMDVVLLPDNDKPGRNFMKTFALELQDVANSVRMVDVGTPREAKGYDVFDWMRDRKADGMDKAELTERIMIMKDASLYMLDGEEVHILNDIQREAEYKLMLTLDGFDLGDFIPGLKGVVRPFVRGDCLGIVGGTGSGKTAMLQAISEWTAPMTVLNFNLELSTGVFYEREASSVTGIPAKDIEKLYNKGSKANTQGGLSHIYTVSLSRVTPAEIRKQFWIFVRLTGLWPEWTLVDYVQLMKGTGQRYERTTDNAEEVRIMAKELCTRMAFTSQKSRPPKSKGAPVDTPPTLHDAKDSGGLENSMSVYMDLRSHPDQTDVKKGVILKNTRGPAGVEFDIGWIGNCTKFVKGALPEPDAEDDMFEVPDHTEPTPTGDEDSVPF